MRIIARPIVALIVAVHVTRPIRDKRDYFATEAKFSASCGIYRRRQII